MSLLRSKAARADPLRLSWVRTQPCLICLRLPVEAHHLLSSGDRGMGMKSPDSYAVPLCPDHHRRLHRNGNETVFFAVEGVDPYEWIEETKDEHKGHVPF